MPVLEFHTRRLECDASDLPQEPGNDWKTVYDVLTDYLQPDSTISVDEAVDRTTKCYMDRSVRASSPINHISIILGDQIPYDNPGQAKLADYFLTFGESCKWLAQTKYSDHESAVQGFYQWMWEDLSDESRSPWDLLDDNEDPMEYVNSQAFRANQMSTELMSRGHLLYLQSFLEYAMNDIAGPNSSEEPRIGDAFVMGAAQWIKFKADETFSLVQKPGDPEIGRELQVKQALEIQHDQKEQPHREGFLSWRSRKKNADIVKKRNDAIKKVNDAIDKKWPYTWSQWQGWKQDFWTAAGSNQYSSKCRVLAQEAANTMAVLEKGLVEQARNES